MDNHNWIYWVPAIIRVPIVLIIAIIGTLFIPVALVDRYIWLQNFQSFIRNTLILD